MLAVYLSGTGNTRHCTEKLAKLIDENSKIKPIESENIVSDIEKEETIIIGYPTQYSDCPYMIKDFIIKNKNIWKGKKVFCLTTMALFSGDGTGCCARILKKYGAIIIGGAQIRMPDSICDIKLLKFSVEKNRKIIKKADRKIERIANQIKNGKFPKQGLKFHHRIAGLLGQRIFFRKKTQSYCEKIKISDECIGCGLCSKLCPTKNIKIENKKALAGDKCTMCYRCISNCPKKAITLLGKKVVEQCKYEKYK